MNSQQEDEFGMFVTTDLFLGDRAGDMSANPVIAMIKNNINQNITDIVQADSTATRNLAGFTTAKSQKRTQVEQSILKIAGAARGYYTSVVRDEPKKALVRLTKSEVEDARDSDVIVIADRIHDVADPIKTLLAAYEITDLDVDNLPVLVNEYRVLLQAPRRQETVSAKAGLEVDKEFSDTRKELADLDDNTAVYEYTKPLLFQEYKMCRAIMNSGGNSGSEGYDVNNITIPAGGSIAIPLNLGSGTNPDPDVYLRVIGGNSGIQLSTSYDNNPSTPIYTLQAGITFKGAISGLGLDLSRPNLIAHNPGTSSVVVRAGNKVNP